MKLGKKFEKISDKIFVLIIIFVGIYNYLSAESNLLPSEKISIETRRILNSIKLTEYRHTIEMNEATCEYYTDCSGLIIYILERVLPSHLQSIRKKENKKRLLAKDFCEFFMNSPTSNRGKDGWKKIEKISDVIPGDIIAYKALNPKPGNTGHVVVVDSESTRTLKNQYCMMIIDSTINPHGNDTRKKGQTGIGKGILWFDVDDDGRPIGYRKGNPNANLTKVPISIGRAVDFATKD